MIEMFQYDFMIRAFLVGIIIGFVAPFLGIFVVLKRYSMLADTLAHISLLGVAIGIFIGVAPTISTIVVVLFLAWIIEYLRSSFNIYSDSLLAVFLSGSLSLSIIFISLNNNFNTSLLSYLFGSILSVKTEDLILIGILGLNIIILMIKYIYDFIYLTLDEDVAQVSGIKVKFLNLLFLTLVSLLIALSIHIVGSLLIGALIVIPIMSALQYRNGFFQTLILGIIFSLIAILSGLTISFYFSIPSGASIVVIALILFLFSIFFNKK
jgi:zinc transport system permease protein